MTPPLLSRGELMELDVDRLVEVRWVAVDRCGRVCLPPQGDAAGGAR